MKAAGSFSCSLSEMPNALSSDFKLEVTLYIQSHSLFPIPLRFACKGQVKGLQYCSKLQGQTFDWLLPSGLLRVWKKLLINSSYPCISNALTSYILLDNVSCNFKGSSKRQGGLPPLGHKLSFRSVGRAKKGARAVSTDAFRYLLNAHDALQGVT